MGARGRKPRPTHLKVLQGEQESRINRNEPLPSEDTVAVPEGISDGARKVWDELAEDLEDKGCLTPWDVYLFEAFCEAVSTYRENRDLLRKHGYTERGAAGGVIKSPYHQIMRDCLESMAKIGSRFGFTPGDRANMTIEKVETGPKQGAERIIG